MQCEKCAFGDPWSEAHYHIIVANGKVTEVWYKPRHDVRYAGVHLSRPYPINVVSLSNKAA
jgi:hypothetical protein